jgi:hypothetical protein
VLWGSHHIALPWTTLLSQLEGGVGSQKPFTPSGKL